MTGDPGPGRILVGVIDGRPTDLAALARVFDETPDIELGVVADTVGRFAAGRQRPGGVVVLDLAPDGIRDVACMGHRVLVVSPHAGTTTVLDAMSAGARGYLSKNADGNEILRAVRAIAAGRSYVSRIVPRAGPRIALSAQERRVLALVAAGERDMDIAAEMAIGIRTVRSYLDRIRDKTGRRRRAELTRFAIEEGIAYQPPSS